MSAAEGTSFTTEWVFSTAEGTFSVAEGTFSIAGGTSNAVEGTVSAPPGTVSAAAGTSMSALQGTVPEGSMLSTTASEKTVTLAQKGVEVSLLEMKSTYSHLNLGSCALEIRNKLTSAETFYCDRDQRLLITATDPVGQVHELEGRRQTVNNSLGRYFILEQNPYGNFTAQPVKNWILMEPALKYKTLNDHEADVEFEKRDKTLNHFSIMIQKRLRSTSKDDHSDEEVIPPAAKKACMKEAKLDDSWISDEDENESSRQGSEDDEDIIGN